MTQRGPYLTESRTVALERQIAETEARINQRIDQLESRLASRVTVDVLRSLTGGLMHELRAMLGTDTRGGTT